MRRSFLITVTTLGVLICLLGGAGLFAALTDTADTGPNTVETAPLAGSADLKLATVVPDPMVPMTSMCGDYVDDLVTGLFSATNVTPGGGPSNFICIKNVGSQPVSLSAAAIDLVDTDLGCTGDEADYGDPACDADDPGELSAVLDIRFDTIDCSFTMYGGPVFSDNLAALVGSPLTLADALATDAVACFSVSAIEMSSYATAALQVAQSDSASWRFRFTGQATP